MDGGSQGGGGGGCVSWTERMAIMYRNNIYGLMYTHDKLI